MSITTIEQRERELRTYIHGFLSDPAQDGQCTNSLLAEVFRRAAASLEAEVHSYTFEDDPRPLYTAPPAPVSVPDFGALTKCIVQRLVDYGSADDDAIASAEEFVYNACRAAMLQGAENAKLPSTMQTAPTLDSSPKIAESPTEINQGKSEPVTTANKLPFEQWLSQQTGTIDVECGCVMTEVFFHWLRVAYEAGNSSVIPDGWVLVPVEPTMSQEFVGYRTLTDTGKMSRLMKTRLSNIYRAMIATAPQQEVKP